MECDNEFEKIRLLLGFNQTQIAKILKIHRLTWWRYEAGQRFPNFKIGRKIAALCAKHGIDFNIEGDEEC